jgi:hypothetical protein
MPNNIEIDPLKSAYMNKRAGNFARKFAEDAETNLKVLQARPEIDVSTWVWAGSNRFKAQAELTRISKYDDSAIDILLTFVVNLDGVKQYVCAEMDLDHFLDFEKYFGIIPVGGTTNLFMIREETIRLGL